VSDFTFKPRECFTSEGLHKQTYSRKEAKRRARNMRAQAYRLTGAAGVAGGMLGTKSATSNPHKVGEGYPVRQREDGWAGRVTARQPAP